MWAELICIGSELLSWDMAETNSLFLSKQLSLFGLEVRYKTVVGDIESDIEGALRMAVDRSPLVIITGGLGPTEDDLTRKAVSKVLNRTLVLNEYLIKKLKQQFETMGKAMPKNNERQALIPNKAVVIDNPIGTAPGFAIEYKNAFVICLPGVPNEMERMFDEGASIQIKERFPVSRPFKLRVIRTCGIAEARIDEVIDELYTVDKDIKIGLSASEKGVDIRVKSSKPQGVEALRLMAGVEEKITARLREYIYGYDNEEMEEIILRLSKKKGVRFSVAESCTGGLISKRITDISGSSACFDRGVVCYSNESKIQILNIPHSLIESYGAVSSQVAMAMADGVRRISNTEIGLGITGIAGPAGGSLKKPVGLVYIALSEKGKEARCKGYNFTGSREMIRIKASQMALDMIRRSLLKI